MAFLGGSQRQYTHADGVGVAVDMGPSCLVIDGCALDKDQAHELAVILLEWSWTK